MCVVCCLCGVLASALLNTCSDAVVSAQHLPICSTPNEKGYSNFDDVIFGAGVDTRTVLPICSMLNTCPDGESVRVWAVTFAPAITVPVTLLGVSVACPVMQWWWIGIVMLSIRLVSRGVEPHFHTITTPTPRSPPKATDAASDTYSTKPHQPHQSHRPPPTPTTDWTNSAALIAPPPPIQYKWWVSGTLIGFSVAFMIGHMFTWKQMEALSLTTIGNLEAELNEVEKKKKTETEKEKEKRDEKQD